jgi:hypothetical protein
MQWGSHKTSIIHYAADRPLPVGGNKYMVLNSLH